MNVNELIDQFVVSIDPNRTIFRKIESAPWIDALETKLPRRFPASFRSLLIRYAFPSFDAGHLHFFANTGDDSRDALAVAIFRDQFIVNATLKSGYIQFARPEDGSYDPICFDARRSVSQREFPIVRLDHEAILCHDRIREVAPISKSFYRFVADLLDRA